MRKSKHAATIDFRRHDGVNPLHNSRTDKIVMSTHTLPPKGFVHMNNQNQDSLYSHLDQKVPNTFRTKMRIRSIGVPPVNTVHGRKKIARLFSVINRAFTEVLSSNALQDCAWVSGTGFDKLPNHARRFGTHSGMVLLNQKSPHARAHST